MGGGGEEEGWWGRDREGGEGEGRKEEIGALSTLRHLFREVRGDMGGRGGVGGREGGDLTAHLFAAGTPPPALGERAAPLPLRGQRGRGWEAAEAKGADAALGLSLIHI